MCFPPFKPVIFILLYLIFLPIHGFQVYRLIPPYLHSNPLLLKHKISLAISAKCGFLAAHLPDGFSFYLYLLCSSVESDLLMAFPSLI